MNNKKKTPLARCIFVYTKCVRSVNEISSPFLLLMQTTSTIYRWNESSPGRPNEPHTIQDDGQTFKNTFLYIFGLASFIKIKFLLINLYQFCSVCFSPVFFFLSLYPHCFWFPLIPSETLVRIKIIIKNPLMTRSMLRWREP